MDQTPQIHRDASQISLLVSRKAPPFLDERGFPREGDPLKQAWQEAQEAFSRLHGQRLLELMEHMLEEIPAGQRVRMEWDVDEIAVFQLRFSNGWVLHRHTARADLDEVGVMDLAGQPLPAAPAWFPRDEEGFSRWQAWHTLLHCFTIDPGVDGKAQERLHELSTQLGGVERSHLPLIRQALVGEEFSTALEHMEISANTASSPTTPSSARRRI